MRGLVVRVGEVEYVPGSPRTARAACLWGSSCLRGRRRCRLVRVRVRARVGVRVRVRVGGRVGG